MANKRLLSPSECRVYVYEDGIAIKAMLKDQDANTLKEVGKWMEDRLEQEDTFDLMQLIANLKQGKLPDEVSNGK